MENCLFEIEKGFALKRSKQCLFSSGPVTILRQHYDDQTEAMFEMCKVMILVSRISI